MPDARRALAALAEEAGLPSPPLIEGAPLGWRQRARLAVRGRSRSPKIGLFEAGSHDVVDIPRCGMQHPLINRVAGALKQALRDTDTAPYRERHHAGLVRYLQVVVERPSQRAQVVVVCNAREADSFMPAAERLRALLGDSLHSLFWNGQPERTNSILGPHWRHLCGAETVCEEIGGARILFPPGAFGQANLDLYDRLVARVGDWLGEAREVADLYSGCGALGMPRLAAGARVHFSERAEDSLHGLRASLALRSAEERERARIHPGDSDEFPDLDGALGRCDGVILDPPRRGIGPRLLARLRDDPPARLVYVSCGLSAFLEQARSLLEGGRLEWVGLETFALFPHSEHVETLALFRRI
jgi:tRNA/tmRNA/rRNA uracil-C5-methylase (TrmA/RlmC/RlmD family)